MLIALSGKARSGKDTAAEALVRRLGYYNTSFALPLKESCRFKFNLSLDDVFTQEGKDRFVPEWSMTVGEILQKEGTEGTKGFWGEDFWIKRWKMTYDAIKPYADGRVVVTDCRFNLEAQTILDMGGKVLHIERPGVEGFIGGRDPNHLSERGISRRLISATVVNDGTLERFRDKVHAQVLEWINEP